MSDKEPRQIEVPYAGGKWTEIIERENGSKVFAVYDNKDGIEEIEYRKNFLHIKDDDTIEVRVPIPKLPWSAPGEPLEPGDSLYEDIREFVYDHIDFYDDRLYDVYSAWVFASWVPEIFKVIPYFFFMGPVNSGKTRCLEGFKYLSRRAVMGSTVSEAAIYQAIEEWEITTLLDETERYNQEKAATIKHLLNSGYRRGQPAIRARVGEGGARSLDLFDVFGFKALSGTEGMYRSLESRSIIVKMMRASRKINFLIDEDQAKDLRSRLMLWRWRTLKEHEGELQEFFANEIPEIFNFTNGRFIELYASLYTIQPKAREIIMDFARDEFMNMLEEEVISEEAQVLTAIFKCRDKVKNGVLRTQEIVEAYNEDKDPSLQTNARSMGWKIKSLGLPRQLIRGVAGWRWVESRLRQFANIYRLPPEITGYDEVENKLESFNEEDQGGTPSRKTHQTLKTHQTHRELTFEDLSDYQREVIYDSLKILDQGPLEDEHLIRRLRDRGYFFNNNKQFEELRKLLDPAISVGIIDFEAEIYTLLKNTTQSNMNKNEEGP
jgi:hypothetical protein